MYHYILLFCITICFASYCAEDISESETVGSDFGTYEKLPCIMPKCGMFFTSRYLLQQHEKKHIQKMIDTVDENLETDTIKVCIAFECTFRGCRTLRKSAREMLEHYTAEHANVATVNNEEIGLRLSQKRPRSLVETNNYMNSPIPQKRPKHISQLQDDRVETEESLDDDGTDSENSEFPETP